MSHSPSRSITSALLGLLCLGLAGCPSDDECGVGDAPANGLVASSTDVTIRYTNLTSLLGNDCPAMDAPDGVVSVSIEGQQEGGTGLITLCIPRPDLLMQGNRSIGTSLSMADVRIFDLMGSDDAGCTYTLDSTRPPSGTATGSGVCKNGDDPAGFAIDLDAAVSLRRTCNGTTDSIAVTLVGRAAVARRQ